MALDVETVAKQLTDSGIVAPGKLEHFVPPKAHPASVDELVAALVKAANLTPFQAAQVKAGKANVLVLGNYTLLDRIGAGGMGQVFKAEHRRMERVVAIKVLPPAMTRDPAALARFQREVKAAARLEHPNIVTAYDADQAGSVHFFVMQYVDGRDLSALVKKDGPLPVGQAVNFILQAAKGLEFAHGEGVIHRDVKPANLLLDRKGTVKILDMGLARIESTGDAVTQAELTGTGTIMGTVDYMSPEQAINTKHADQRADIYSLGMSLYYLLSGKAAYGGESVMEKLMAHQNQPIPSLRAIQTTVPRQLEAIFEKMVAKKVDVRYQSMSEVIADLEACGIRPDQSANTQQPFGSFNDEGLTNFLKEISVGQLRPVRAQKPPAPLFGKNRKQILLIGGGIVGVTVLLTAVLISHRTKEGNESDAAKLAPKEDKPAVVAKGWQGWPADAPTPAVAPFDADQARKHQETWAAHLKVPVEYENSIGMKFVLIPPGEFTMGSAPAEIEEALKAVGDDNFWQDCAKSETPRHRVILTQPIYLGVHEVTQGQYERVMAKNPSLFAATGDGNDQVVGMDTSTHPVEIVSWNDAAEFCAKLSLQEKLKPFYFRSGETMTPLDGTGYRLPTEAEWEFSCRAGTMTKYWTGDTDEELLQAGWFGANSGGRTHAVGELKANPFGLHDIHGNLGEWVQGGWEPTYYGQFQEKPALDPGGPSPAGSRRVLRGGGWADAAFYCRASARAALDPTHRNGNIGFRVALVVDAVKKGESTRPATSLAAAPPPAIAPFDAQQAKAHQEAWAKHLGTKVEQKNSVGMTLVLIPPGEFLMGSSPEQNALARKIAEVAGLKPEDGVWGRLKEEEPQHKVAITKPYWFGSTEVTFGQFKTFVEATAYVTEAEQFGFGNSGAIELDDKITADQKNVTWRTPSYAVTDDSPVTQVTWNDAVQFCNWLSEQEKLKSCYRQDADTGWIILASGTGYRLPTEAEWEYACRAGTTTQFSFGDDPALLDSYDWFNKNSGWGAKAVGLKIANPFGLFDMHGNVFEWCQDFHASDYYSKSPANDPIGPSSGSVRVGRGGLWAYSPVHCRSAYRHNNAPSDRFNSHGFRVLLAAEKVTPGTPEREVR